jgi:hypothetical protein
LLTIGNGKCKGKLFDVKGRDESERNREPGEEGEREKGRKTRNPDICGTEKNSNSSGLLGYAGR